MRMTREPAIKSERATRKQIVDVKLRAAKWQVVPFDPEKPLSANNNCAIEEFPTENGPADYALCIGGEILGVVEAKKLTLGPQEVLSQAERYSLGLKARRLDFDGYRAPFLYSTNGEVIWFHDIRDTLKPLLSGRRIPHPGSLARVSCAR